MVDALDPDFVDELIDYLRADSDHAEEQAKRNKRPQKRGGMIDDDDPIPFEE